MSLQEDLLLAARLCGMEPGGKSCHRYQLFFIVHHDIGSRSAINDLQRALETAAGTARLFENPSKGRYALTPAGHDAALRVAARRSMSAARYTVAGDGECSFLVRGNVGGLSVELGNVDGTYTCRVNGSALPGPRVAQLIAEHGGEDVRRPNESIPRELHNLAVRSGWELVWQGPQRVDTGPPSDATDGGGGEAIVLGVDYRQPEASQIDHAPFVVDPEAADRATRRHVELQNGLARAVRAAGFVPRSPGPNEPDFDLAWEQASTVYVVEVKSISDESEVRQLRVGLGQILEYRHCLRESHDLVVAVLYIERAPADSRWLAICEAVAVVLRWPGVDFPVSVTEPKRDPASE